jgi:hypothetical protein
MESPSSCRQRGSRKRKGSADWNHQGEEVKKSAVMETFPTYEVCLEFPQIELFSLETAWFGLGLFGYCVSSAFIVFNIFVKNPASI